MPLRQSTLKFGLHATASVTTLCEVQQDLTLQPTVGSPIDEDTIVVATTITTRQLPTPSESATEVSSQSSQVGTEREVQRSRSRRVSSTRKRKSACTENLDTMTVADHEKLRSVSGDTLVADEANVGELDSKLSENEKLWKSTGSGYDDMQVDEGDLCIEVKEDDETSSVITVCEESEDEAVCGERRAAKKAKMQENSQKWEERRNAAEKSATRRSGRASLISKASEMLDSIKESVLGKRTRNAIDRVDDRSRPNNRPRSSAESIPGPIAKKARISEADTVTKEPTPKKLTNRREKKWLVSGLYAGQPRMFDARLTENKNRRKSKTTEEVVSKENTVVPLPMFAGERLLQHGRDFKLPFDIFSPLPAGQPKPDEWKKVNKNVFVGDAAAEWRTNKFVEHSTCMCDDKTGCDQDCMNRYMYYECDERNCKLSEFQCGNRAFEGLKKRSKIGGKYNVGVEVIKTVDRGYGVRSNRTFEPNQIIVEYTGEIITQEECEQRMRTIYKENECYYLMLFDQNMIIDATRGSIARFVNHSCEPNCRMEKWTVGGKPRMALFAGDRGIMTGEELTYDYNFDPYSQKNVQECRCGANNCRGVLGPKPKPEPKRNSPEDEPAKKKEGKLSGAKSRVAEAVEGSKSNKKRKVTPVVKRIKTTKKVSASKPGKQNASPKRKVLVKKAALRKTPTMTLARSDSKLKKMLVGAKAKASGLKGQRAASTSSSTTGLMPKNSGLASPRSASSSKQVPSLTKSSHATGRKLSNTARKSSSISLKPLSLKAKAKSISRSVRGKAKAIVVAA